MAPEIPATATYDALLVVSFGGPNGPDDVLPFLENVLRGRDVPHERMLEVAEHYHQFGGKSPINDQNRTLIAAVEKRLDALGYDLPVYWGNRNWHPLLADTIRTMVENGVHRALAWFTSAYSSYSGCRQYRENLSDACAAVGESAPQIDRLRLCFNHPKFVAAQITCVQQALERLPPGKHDGRHVLFTAHSIPRGMADSCAYESQLREVARLISAGLDLEKFDLVFQSRSGPPHVPWLEPDVCDAIRQLAEKGVEQVVVAPIGFLSDHLEVLYDLDTEAAGVAGELGLEFQRAASVGTDSRIAEMIVDLVVERAGSSGERLTIGELPANPDVCPDDCCLVGRTTRPKAT